MKRMSVRRRKRASALLLTLLLFFFALLFLMPMVLTVSNSFMSAGEIAANYGAVFPDSANASSYIAQRVRLRYIPDMVTLQQYRAFLLQSPEYLYKFWNSVFLTLPIVVFQTAVAAMAAYGFASYRGKGRELLFFGYIILMLMPYQVTLAPNYLVAKFLGLLNTRWAIILPGAFTPLSVFILTKSMRRLPPSIREAASLDGANDWQIFTRVYLPQCKGAIYSVVILVFIDSWNMVEQVLVLLAEEEKRPLSVFLSQINAGEVGLAFAVAAVYMVPPLLMFLHGEEHLVAGIADSGDLKG